MPPPPHPTPPPPQLLAEFVTGMVGDGSSAAAGLVSRIARVVVAGGAIGPPPVLAGAAPRTVAGSGALMGTMGSKASGAAAGAVAASSRDLMSERFAGGEAFPGMVAQRHRCATTRCSLWQGCQSSRTRGGRGVSPRR